MRDFSRSSVVLTIVFLSVAVSAVHGQDTDPLRFLPEDNDVKGWIKDWEPSVAEDLAGLTALIDGAAPQYVDSGAKKVVFQDYSYNGEQFLTVELYGMQTLDNARNIFNQMFVEQPTVFKDIGVESHLVEKLMGAYVLEFWRDSFFVRIITMSKTEEARSASISFATSIDRKLRE